MFLPKFKAGLIVILSFIWEAERHKEKSCTHLREQIDLICFVSKSCTRLFRAVISEKIF